VDNNPLPGLAGEPDAVVQAKQALRRQVIAARLQQTDAERHRWDDARQAMALGLLDDLMRGMSGGCRALLAVSTPTLSVYLSQAPEPETLGLAGLLHRKGWRVLVPSPGVGGRPWAEPAWAWYAEPLQVTPRGIPVPAAGSCVPSGWPPASLDLADVIVMPGLAGALDGSRLGYGGGWYDRALSGASIGAPRWLLLNDSELLDDVPHDVHDQPVDLIITPGGVHRCRPGR